MKRKKSLIVSVLLINLSLVAVYLFVFFLFSLHYRGDLLEERQTAMATALDKANSDFQHEFHRLISLTSLCIEDTNFVMALSNRLDPESFRQHAARTAEKLSFIKYSLPYANSVFAYCMGSDTMILDAGNFMQLQEYIDFYPPKYVSVDFKGLDPASMGEGLILVNSDVLFIEKLYHHGFVGIHIDPYRFANINNVLDNRYHYYVINEQGQLLLDSRRLPLSDSQLEQALAAEPLRIGGTDYLCQTGYMPDLGLTGLIVADSSIITTPISYLRSTSLVFLLLIFISSFLLVFLNIKIYIPLKSFAQSVGNNGNQNEISFINDKIQDLLHEIYLLSQQNASAQGAMPEEAALSYLLLGGQQLHPVYLRPLQEKYAVYSLVAITAQTGSGEPVPTLPSLLRPCLAPQAGYCLIPFNAYQWVVITHGPTAGHTTELIVSACRQAAPASLQVYLGFAEGCANIQRLSQHLQRAFSSLEAAPALAGGGVSASCGASLQKKRLDIAVQNRLGELAGTGELTLLEKEINRLLFQDSPLLLKEFTSLYSDISHVLEQLWVSKAITGECPIPYYHIYHTGYAMDSLLLCAKKLQECGSEQANPLKDRILGYIHEHLSGDLGLEAVSSHASITPVYLSSWFKKAMGVGYLSYINSVRIQRAVEILQTDKTIKIYELAKQVGIENPTTFIRQFKKHIGVTPDQYRKRL